MKAKKQSAKTDRVRTGAALSSRSVTAGAAKPKRSSAGKAKSGRAKKTPGKKKAKITVPEAPPLRFFGRDESWLRFNGRVLEEAEDGTNPLLERVKFLAITASNLDEFVEIRIAGILQRIEDGEATERDESGLSPQELLDRVSVQMHAFVRAQYRCWRKHLLPELERAKIRVLPWKRLSEQQREFAIGFYEAQVDPLLTPVTIDPSHPFPRVLNKALCVALLLRHKRRAASGVKTVSVLGVVTVPRSLPRLIPLPAADGATDVVLLHDLIEAQAERMYRGYEVLETAPFRVTRNSNLYMQEEESRSVLESVRAELHNRRKGDAVRMEIDCDASEELSERLRLNFELDAWQVFRTEGPVNLSRLMNLYAEVNRPELKYRSFAGREYRLAAKCADLFEDLRRHDVLLHHPFDSYKTVEDFIKAGAVDPLVMSMKQTLYRTSADSSMFGALVDAAQGGAGKDVTVVVELMARFDEASNIRWARELEDAGVGVYHGVFGLKTHCKLALLVRRDPDGVVRRYAHLGTGNYNPVTAKFYTDISLLTAEVEITSAVQAVFNYLTALTADEGEDEEVYRPLLVAPLTLAGGLLKLIGREAEHARAGRPAAIVAKMNGLLDRPTIEALYAASQAGVEVDLIIRGMCALRPGVKGLSERIRVRSLVGRFLEHSRIFWFANGGGSEVFCGSPDWMPRNLYERCETVFPVTDPELRERLENQILRSYLRDNVKARLLGADGQYTRASEKHQTPFSAQEYLMQVSQGAGERSAPEPRGIAAEPGDRAPEELVARIDGAEETAPDPAL